MELHEQLLRLSVERGRLRSRCPGGRQAEPRNSAFRGAGDEQALALPLRAGLTRALRPAPKADALASVPARGTDAEERPDTAQTTAPEAPVDWAQETPRGLAATPAGCTRAAAAGLGSAVVEGGTEIRGGLEPARSELIGSARDMSWYHTLELPGLVTDGWFDLRPYIRHYRLPERMDGLRALDVGTWDGFWAFEMERRGAEVVALDLDDERDLDWPPRFRPNAFSDQPRGRGFALAHELLDSRVERVVRSIYD